jgi:hypothetical protein
MSYAIFSWSQTSRHFPPEIQAQLQRLHSKMKIADDCVTRLR